MNKEKLFQIKKDIEKNNQQIQKNEGKLETLFDTNKKRLNLDEDTPNKTVLKEIDNKVQELQKQQEKDQKRLDSLMEEIEEEVEQWDD